jgi:addiction module RelE/StbE family toxin
MRVIWRARALSDIAKITRYVATDNPSAAARIARELIVAGDSLCDFPRRGRPTTKAGIRELVVTPPYLLVYRITEPDTVTILRIWHGAQDRR